MIDKRIFRVRDDINAKQQNKCLCLMCGRLNLRITCNPSDIVCDILWQRKYLRLHSRISHYSLQFDMMLLLSFYIFFRFGGLPSGFGWIRIFNANLTRHLVRVNTAYPIGNRLKNKKKIKENQSVSVILGL